MVRRLVHVYAVLLVTITAMILPSAHGRPAAAALVPRSQTIGGQAFKPTGDLQTRDLARTLESAIGTAPGPFTHLLLRWRASGAAEHGVELAVRASLDRRSWTEWGHLIENEDLHDEREPDVHWSSILHTGLARFWQVRVRISPAAEGITPVLQAVHIETVDTRGDGRAVESTSLTAPAVVGSKQFDGQPAFVPRAAWGGSEVLRNSRSPKWHPATHLVVHHSADPNSLRPHEATWAARLRAQWAFHRYQRGWGDLGYNWVIDPNGVIYEGRSGSSDATRDAVGIHDGANEGSISVMLIGTFGPRRSTRAMVPTAAAQQGLVRLLAWKARQRGIDPLGSSRYYGCATSSACARVHPGAIVRNIAGHREVIPSSSACPGDLAMDVLPSIRARVAEAYQAPALPGDVPIEVPPDTTPTTPGADPSPTPMPVALMPNLIGRGEMQAKEALARLGIYMVLVDYQGRDRLGDRYDQFPAYAVVSHDPPPNSTVRPGIMVKLGVRAP